MSVKVEIFRDLDAVGVAAKGALSRTAQDSLFDRLEWFARTRTHCPPRGDLIVARAVEEANAAWLMLVASNRRTVGLASWYTLAFAPVLTGYASMVHATPAFVALARHLRGRLGTIMLDHVPADTAQALANGFRTGGWLADVLPQTANWSIDVTGKDFTTFWGERPGQLRSTTKRKAAKTAMALTIADCFDAEMWEEYCAVYADSWKPEEGSLAFLRAMAEDEGAAGCLRMGIARIDGRAVATQLWTVERGVAIIHKLAHRQDVANLSPGTILSKAMFEHVIDQDGVRLIDFGTGDDGYKADWMDTRVMRMRVELTNPYSVAGLRSVMRTKAARLVASVRNR